MELLFLHSASIIAILSIVAEGRGGTVLNRIMEWESQVETF